MRDAVVLEESQEEERRSVSGISGPHPEGRRTRAKEVVVVFLMSMAFLLFNISSPGIRIFDEWHYTDAAQSIYHGQGDTNAEHPPLGKYLIGAGMMMAGDNPVGWRVMPAVFGSLLLSVAFLWMWKLGRHVAWTAVVLIATNGFWFVMSRIAMLSIFELTFTVIGLYLLTERRFWMSGAALGLAAACRWNALFALLLVAVYALCSDGVLAAIKISVSSVCSYTLAWLPLVGLHPVRLIRAQEYMLHFHVHYAAVPTLKDNWYHWLVRTIPENGLNHMLANPLITVVGIIALVALARKGEIVGLAGAVFLLQWAVIPRDTYYYYYLDALTMMSIAAAAFVGRYKLAPRKHEVRLCVPLAILSAAWFLTHYAAFMALQSPYDALFQF